MTCLYAGTSQHYGEMNTNNTNSEPWPLPSKLNRAWAQWSHLAFPASSIHGWEGRINPTPAKLPCSRQEMGVLLLALLLVSLPATGTRNVSSGVGDMLPPCCVRSCWHWQHPAGLSSLCCLWTVGKLHTKSCSDPLLRGVLFSICFGLLGDAVAPACPISPFSPPLCHWHSCFVTRRW